MTPKQNLANIRSAYAALTDSIEAALIDLERTAGAFVCERPSVRTIQEIVCAHYRVPVSAMASPVRTDVFTRARHVAMYLARTHTRYSFIEVARCFARTHGAVMCAVRSINNAVSTDQAFAAELAQIEAAVRIKLTGKVAA